jgi:hypothetical protein
VQSVNRIQRSRKDLSFNVEDRIIVVFDTTTNLKSVIETFADYIKSETLTTDFSFGTVTLDDKSTENTIDEDKLNLSLGQA